MPRRLEPPTGVRKRKKPTVKIRRNPLLRFLHMIQMNIFIKKKNSKIPGIIVQIKINNLLFSVIMKNIVLLLMLLFFTNLTIPTKAGYSK